MSVSYSHGSDFISPAVCTEEEPKNRSRVVHWRKITWKGLDMKSVEKMEGSSHRSRKKSKKEEYHGSQKGKECVNIIMRCRVVRQGMGERESI